jgi:hypothetical protein
VRIWQLAGCSAVLGCVLLPTASGSTFTVSAGTFGQLTSSEQVGIGDALNSAFAGRGTVGVSSLISSPAPFGLSNVFRASGSSAQSSIDDLVFSGPGATVQTEVRIPFHAFFSLGIDSLGNLGGDVFKGIASGGVTLSGSMQCGNSCGYSFRLDTAYDAPDPFTPTGSPGSGGQLVYSLDFLRSSLQLLTTDEVLGQVYAGSHVTRDFVLSGSFDSGLMTVPVGVPILVNFSMSSGASTTAFFVSGAFAQVDGLHTLGFQQGVPVFDLPAGFTANAPSIGLVNDVIPATDAPEPGSAWMAGLGCVALLAGVTIRRKRAKPRADLRG